jgi:protoporphyrin/coproporphyrin ferrochelatase
VRPAADSARAGVLLLAHGAPERVEDVEQYLRFVRPGRPPNPQVIEEVKHRYASIGGGSPLLQWTRAQAEALERLLGIPVFFAMRNWHPFIRDTIEKVREARVQRLAGICLAPQYSELSVGLYIKRTEEAWGSENIAWATSYHDEPGLIEAFAERLRPVAGGRRVLFTAHSLPERALATGDPYDRQCRETAALVAARTIGANWDFAYQSQGMTADKWLGPTVESFLDRYAEEGVSEVVVDPIGFVCDHVEILYDVDIHFRGYAAQRGIGLSRPESLNGSPTFTAALAEVAKRCLQ